MLNAFCALKCFQRLLHLEKVHLNCPQKSKRRRSLDINLVSDCLPTSIYLPCKLNAFSDLVYGACLQNGRYSLKWVVMDMPVQSYITSVNQNKGTGD